ncbi:MAG: maltose acetyltransferase [Bacteroidetes bacterium MedPE-SWsnd-G2]|nr:MAG: maltose acetyltransferase [Bacteroidetes bacterium MedPE-SWsnd-G2]
MTEREKMLSGAHYKSRDPELIAMYHNARALLQRFNSANSKEIEEKHNILTQLLHNCEDGVWIEAPFFCDYGSHLSIGQNTFINTNCVFLDCNFISIGSNCLIAPNVQIYTASHPIKASERLVTKNNETSYLTSCKPVSIGDNVWIGGNTVICPGVSIGNNVTIGAGSVVTKSIPNDVLAFGSPCKVIKSLE